MVLCSPFTSVIFTAIRELVAIVPSFGYIALDISYIIYLLMCKYSNYCYVKNARWGGLAPSWRQEWRMCTGGCSAPPASFRP